ncbi:hypothetical protein H0H81_010073 [Sphagnurus paluster]|uniref:Uncharacterized protein n=1 Tax=Sphagnurus paluster TaxID=117069 RepID=A0A9P7K2N4_9AGAR|nr:hypothetical protein H0H81_010073 [Sphagnurus paluster]
MATAGRSGHIRTVTTDRQGDPRLPIVQARKRAPRSRIPAHPHSGQATAHHQHLDTPLPQYPRTIIQLARRMRVVTWDGSYVVRLDFTCRAVPQAHRLPIPGEKVRASLVNSSKEASSYRGIRKRRGLGLEDVIAINLDLRLGIRLHILLLCTLHLAAEDILPDNVLVGEVEERMDLCHALRTGELRDLGLLLAHDVEGEDGDVGPDDAPADGLAIALAGAVAKVTFGEEEAHMEREEHALLLGAPPKRSFCRRRCHWAVPGAHRQGPWDEGRRL